MKPKNKASKRVCDNCGKETRRMYRKNCKFLCWFCYIKTFKEIISPRRTMKEALTKTYLIRPTRSGKVGALSFPSILIGHKVKLILVDEE